MNCLPIIFILIFGQSLNGVSWVWSSPEPELLHEMNCNAVHPCLPWNLAESELGQDPDWTEFDDRILPYADFEIIPTIGQGLTSFLPHLNGAPATPDHIGWTAYLENVSRHTRQVVRRYREHVSMWCVEGELNEARAATWLDWRSGFSWWSDEFCDMLIATLVDAVKAEDPGARVGMAFHTDIHNNLHSDRIARLYFGRHSWTEAIQRWEKYLDFVGLDSYPCYYTAENRGREVGLRVTAARWLTHLPVYVLETQYPLPGPGNFIPHPVNFSLACQAWYLHDAYISSVQGGASGFFTFNIYASGIQYVYSDDDLAILAQLGDAFRRGNTRELLSLVWENKQYMAHFGAVIQVVENGLGVVIDGRRTQGFYQLQRLYK